MRTFIAMYQTAVSGFTWTWSPYFVEISFRRSEGGVSNIQSAWPFSTWVTSASAERPNFWMITSGLPFGCASFDHSLKNVFRTSLICLFGLYWTNLYRNSGSPFVKWNVTVPLASLTTTPLSRLHVFGLLTQASPPTMTLYQVPAFGLWPILKSRSNVYLTSLAFSSLPSENLIPLRSVNVYVLPPPVGFGTEVARSATSFVPSVPLARLNPTRPSWVMISSCHSCSV